jgi:hypothetical protein
MSRRIAGVVRRIDDAEVVARALGEEFLEDALDDMEAKHALEAAGQVAADIIIALERAGPLALYAEERRKDAASALRLLLAADPNDPVAVAQAQAEVNEYLRLCAWIRGRMEEAQQAEHIINEQYGRQGRGQNATLSDQD